MKTFKCSVCEAYNPCVITRHDSDDAPNTCIVGASQVVEWLETKQPAPVRIPVNYCPRRNENCMTICAACSPIGKNLGYHCEEFKRLVVPWDGVYDEH